MLAEDEDVKMIRDAARRIARERIAPLAAQVDRGERGEEFIANLRLLAQNGFMALNVDAAHGGTQGRARRPSRQRSRSSAVPAPRPG